MKRAEKPCAQCGTIMCDYPSVIAKRRWCSTRCFGNYRAAIGFWRGPGSPNFVHGRARTPEYVREVADRWAINNPERVTELGRNWRQRNPEKVAANNRKQHSARRAVKGHFTDEDLRQILERQKHRCVYCKVTLTRRTKSLDHILPVSKGGTNWPDNLQFTCRSCNCRKHNRTHEQFARAMGMLL